MSLKGQKFSEEHKQKIGLAHKGRKGNKSGNWKGGKFKNAKGYVFILMPEHPFALKNGYVRHSHLVIEKKLGRYIKPKEIVHHINGIVDDDSPDNLQLFPNVSAHNKIHWP